MKNTIKDVHFYFAIDNETGYPEKHTQTFIEFKGNVPLSLSTGEVVVPKFPIADDYHTFKLENGFYFGSGKYGTLLAVQFDYEDGSKGWIKSVQDRDRQSENMNVLIGSWTKGKTLAEIKKHAKYTGLPLIGYRGDYVEVKMKRIPSSKPRMKIDQTIFMQEFESESTGVHSFASEPQTPDAEYNPVFLARDSHSSLYKYGQKEIRNARHRGPRESEKVLQDDREVLFDLGTLSKDIGQISSDISLVRSKWLNRGKISQNTIHALAQMRLKVLPEVGDEAVQLLAQGEINSGVIQLNEMQTPQLNLIDSQILLAACNQDIADLQERVKNFESTN